MVKIWQFTTIRVDITQRNDHKEALARSEANLNTIYENTHIGYVLVDENLNLLSFNQTAEAFALNELHHQAYLGEYMPNYFTPDRKEFLIHAAQEVLNGKDHFFELNYAQADGSMHWYNLRLLLVKKQRRQYPEVSGRDSEHYGKEKRRTGAGKNNY